MGTNDSNPEKIENTGSSSSQANGSTMPRAHSNLDILSQTAAVVEEVSLCENSSDSSSTTSDISKGHPARISPSEHHHQTLYHIPKANAYYPVDGQCQKSFLALPEISTSNQNGKTSEYHHKPQPSIFLEKKRGFLPPALSFETGGGILVGGQPFSMEASSNYYSPGLYLSYSNGSGITATSSSGCCNLVAVQRVMSPPLDQVMSKQQLYTTAATVSTGSNHSNSGGGSSPPSGADGDTAVNSFLANPSNSFSSAGGASVSSSANMAAVPTSSLYQFANANATHPPFPMYSTSLVPSPQQQQQSTENAKGGVEFPDEMLRENLFLRQQLASCNTTIIGLQNQVELLQNEIRQLRQVPSGKISQIPLEEMLAIMREYGSEMSDTAMPPRKSFVQKASVVRQFRRWNPNFTEWFVHINGKWIPKLGIEGEKKRRQEARLAYSEQRSKKQKTESCHDNATNDTKVASGKPLRKSEGISQKEAVLEQESEMDVESSNIKAASTQKVKNIAEI